MNLEFLEHENNLDVLREFGKLALGEIHGLKLELAKLKNSQLNEDQLRLFYQDRLCRLKSKLFGRGTGIAGGAHHPDTRFAGRWKIEMSRRLAGLCDEL